LKSNELTNCPICGNEFKTKSLRRHDVSQWGTFPVSDDYFQYSCHNPTIDNPLHYYSHITGVIDYNQLFIQEFSLELDTKFVLVINNFVSKQTWIKNGKLLNALKMNFILVPDFPKCESLKKKVKTSIIFS